MSQDSKPIIGLTVGDPAGIGPEITVKTVLNHPVKDVVRPLVFADEAVVRQALEQSQLSAKIQKINDPEEMKDEDILYFVESNVITEPVEMGEVAADCGRAAYEYYNNAIDWAIENKIVGIATAPLQKEALQAGGCASLDHTNILKAKIQSRDITTLFMVDDLRVFFLTRHIPLRDVGDAITADLLTDASKICLQFLKQLGVDNPLLAIAGLNPHSSDNGMFGREELDVIEPAIDKMKSEGLRVVGTVPADSVFHLAKEGYYDGVISLYHDQGHIAIKTLDFYRTVSLTMGAPFLRTSVDHGTAFGIAGQDKANETSMVEAVLCAGKYAQRIRDIDYRTL